MNILFFLTPKTDVCYIHESDTIADAVDTILKEGYTVVPVLDDVSGRYAGSISAIDLLQAISLRPGKSVEAASETRIFSLPRRRSYTPVRADCEIEDLLQTAASQNFVPVVDDTGAFIGIITRRELLKYLTEKQPKA